MIFFIILILQVMGWYHTTVSVDFLGDAAFSEIFIELSVAGAIAGNKAMRK